MWGGAGGPLSTLTVPQSHRPALHHLVGWDGSLLKTPSSPRPEARWNKSIYQLARGLVLVVCVTGGS